MRIEVVDQDDATEIRIAVPVGQIVLDIRIRSIRISLEQAVADLIDAHLRWMYVVIDLHVRISKDIRGQQIIVLRGKRAKIGFGDVTAEYAGPTERKHRNTAGTDEMDVRRRRRNHLIDDRQRLDDPLLLEFAEGLVGTAYRASVDRMTDYAESSPSQYRAK